MVCNVTWRDFCAAEDHDKHVLFATRNRLLKSVPIGIGLSNSFLESHIVKCPLTPPGIAEIAGAASSDIVHRLGLNSRSIDKIR